MENSNQKPVTFEDIEHNEEINEYITKGNEYLGVMNYTEHGFAHLKEKRCVCTPYFRRFGIR